MSKKDKKKSNTNQTQSNVKPANVKINAAPFDLEIFNTKYKFAAIGAFAFILLIYLFVTFKNIAYPLFWADESMTAVGAQRVMQYGYPKVHDGKNVWYDLRHTNPKLGIDEKTDAYIGGTSWGHYYYALIGLTLANGEDDIYAKTAIFRSTFAILGIVGILIFGWLITLFFPDTFSKFAFLAGFTLLCLLSVSLGLLIKEVRYYAPTIFLTSIICGAYIATRFAQKLNIYVASFIILLCLWMLFMTFAPVYFILMVAIGLTEAVIAIQLFRENEWIKKGVPVWGGLALSLVFIYPFLQFFKTFEISDAMAVFNGYNSKMYWENVATVLKYFRIYEPFWLFISVKLLVLFNIKNVLKNLPQKFWASLFFTCVLVLSALLISRIPNFIYTRYIIFMQPIMAASILLDVFILWEINRIEKPTSFVFVLVISFFCFGIFLFTNLNNITSRLSELTEPYKGPLDYTIPFIKEKYKKTDTLVIAANYEETSYMYYLGSKVVVGFIGNNLDSDRVATPDVICYRKPWGNFTDIFMGYLQKTPYDRTGFPVYDNPVNNIPELNFMPAFNHRFKNKMAANEQEATEIFTKK
ncbi:MAG: hypothetical protein SFY32_06595 [Bacteroidota bacterium]|nr:hypothetical protein [Bacteroidota bacterium]